MKAYRSWLFVPGDSEKKLLKGESTTADALILDLEDSVMPTSKDKARAMVAEYLSTRPRAARKQKLWVRVNPDDDATLADLVGIVRSAPDGIVVPKTTPADLVRISHFLDALERREGIEASSIALLPVATETPEAVFNLGKYQEAGLARLAGLTWGAEDLSTALGASTNRGPDGSFAFTYQIVRSLCLIAAKASGVPAIETLYAALKDTNGLIASSRAARVEGFSGRLAIHPDQVEPINQAFTPDANELEAARRIVAAFAAQPGVGTIQFEGRMLDIPHLKQAELTLRAGRGS